MTPDWQEAFRVLTAGGVAVLPTDTIYGLHGLATAKSALDRIYALKGRHLAKPCIVLLPTKTALNLFGVSVDNNLTNMLAQYWPGPTSIILPVPDDRFAYLHRGTYCLAFRVPKYAPLLQLLNQTGPLVSTSANTSGAHPATDIPSAKNYFDTLVDYYLDTGPLTNPPSRVFNYVHGKMVQLR
jgi:L-threonylcarbamoyladenylate synthase